MRGTTTGSVLLRSTAAGAPAAAILAAALLALGAALPAATSARGTRGGHARHTHRAGPLRVRSGRRRVRAVRSTPHGRPLRGHGIPRLRAPRGGLLVIKLAHPVPARRLAVTAHSGRRLATAHPRRGAARPFRRFFLRLPHRVRRTRRIVIDTGRAHYVVRVSPLPERPPIVHRPIPYGPTRRAQMAAYAKRHYGIDSFRIRGPHVIVEHYTVSSTWSSAWNAFAPDVPDPELHELPGVCAHFIIARDGTIYQLVPLTIMCRHTVGLDYTAIGIEHVGFSDQQVMGDRRELDASLSLTRWLRCRFQIRVRNVIGHSESLSSPYHRERVPSLRHQTHGDMTHGTMSRYRRRIAQLGC